MWEQPPSPALSEAEGAIPRAKRAAVPDLLICHPVSNDDGQAGSLLPRDCTLRSECKGRVKESADPEIEAWVFLRVTTRLAAPSFVIFEGRAILLPIPWRLPTGE